MGFFFWRGEGGLVLKGLKFQAPDIQRLDSAIQWIINISINLLVVYGESMNLIGYITCRLSADSQQL